MLRDIRLVFPRPSRRTEPTPGEPVDSPSRVTAHPTREPRSPRQIDGAQYGFGNHTPVRTLHSAMTSRNGRTFLFSRPITGARAAPEIAIAAEMRASGVVSAYCDAEHAPPG